MRIAFVVGSLDYGGAQRQLLVAAGALHGRGHEVLVISMYSGGPLGDVLRTEGVTTEELGKSGRWDTINFGRRLGAALRRHRPEVLYGLLPTPNLLILAARAIVPGAKIVWGVRGTRTDFGDYDRFVRATSRLEPRLGRFADRIILNSEAARLVAAQRGYPREKLAVIRNGIDTNTFAPDRSSGAALRREWTGGRNDLLVGLVGRLDPVKDHRTFIRAARLLDGDIRFVCVGGGPGEELSRLRALVDREGLGDRMLWAGDHRDMSAVYNALDVLCLSSVSEGFPNAVAEGMACGVPCVVTDVGDAADIVGTTGRVVPAGAPDAMAAAISSLLDLSGQERSALGVKARAQVVARYGVDRMTEELEGELRRVSGGDVA